MNIVYKKATSEIKTQKILSFLVLSDVGIFLGISSFEFDVGIVNLHPSKGTNWVTYAYQNYFDSYGYSPPQKLSQFFLEENVRCLYAEYKIRNLDSSCAALCLYIIHLTKVLGTDFCSAVPNSNYQTIYEY